MTITEQQILELKRKASEIRDKSLQAKATMIEVTSSIDNYKNELKSLGIKDIDNIDEEVKAQEVEIEKVYNSALEKIKNWI